MEIFVRGKNLGRFAQLLLFTIVLTVGVAQGGSLSKEDREVIERLEFLATLELLESEIPPKKFLQIDELKGKKKSKKIRKTKRKTRRQGNEN